MDEPWRPWRPLFARDDPVRAGQYDALHDGVPTWLVQTLLDWIHDRVVVGSLSYRGEVDETTRRLRWIERRLRVALDWRGGVRATANDLLKRAREDAELCLGTVDLLLAELSSQYGGEHVSFGVLAEALDQSGSAWRAVWRRNRHSLAHLERRVQPELEERVDAAIAKGGRPGEYLRQAWERCYGRDQNADGGYRDAVRALEAALKPIVSPRDSNATLGTMIRVIRNKPETFRFVLQPKGVPESANVFADLIATVWTAQLDRHGTDDQTIPLNVTIDQARAAAGVAAVVLDWINNGFFAAVG